MTTKPSKGAAAFLALFGLPFLGAGLFFFFSLISGRGNSKPLETILGIMFSLFFAAIGGGLIYAGIAGYGKQKQQLEMEIANPHSPWLWRKDWSARRAQSQNKNSEIGWWLLAIFCDMIVLPVAAMLGPKLWAAGDLRILLVIGFALLGVTLLGAAVRATIRRQRYGDTYFEFDALPFSPGDRLSGRIHLRLEARADHAADLQLRCVRKIATGSGEDRSTKRVVLWQADKNVPSGAIAPGPIGRAIPVDFELPAEALPRNQDNSDDQIVWELHAKADVPGVNYTDNFEIPVFRSAESASRASSTMASDPATTDGSAFSGAAPRDAMATAIHQGQSRGASAATIGVFVALVIAMFGWMAWRMVSFRARANEIRAASLPRSNPSRPKVFSAPLTEADVKQMLAQPPQVQAEELLARAIAHDERALGALREQVGEWVGRIQMSDRMKELERRSEFSRDLRVRQANVDINLALEGWHKNEEAADALIERAQNDPEHRAWAVYYLGMLAGRDVAYDRIHGVLLLYARNDPDPAVRQWAVEGMRFLGTDEALDELFVSFTEDPSMAVRDRAGCNLSDCGIFTRKQRMKMVPKFLELAKNPKTTGQMRTWSFLALQEITDENLLADAAIWSRWYEEHGAEKMAEFERLQWWQVRGDE